MSHEIRTPMNAIMGFNELLEMPEEQHMQKAYIREIRTQGAHLLKLVHNILLLTDEATAHEVTIEKTDMKALLEEVKKAYYLEAAEKSIQFIEKVAIRNAFYYCDSMKVKQILTNLLENSAKFTNSGVVSFTVVEERETMYADSVTLSFTISDTGQGIQKENIKRILKPFEQEDNSFTRLKMKLKNTPVIDSDRTRLYNPMIL